MAGRLERKVAIVTGSGQGIGRSVALAMSREGAMVLTNNRHRGAEGGDAETVAREITNMGGQAIPFFGDVSRFDVAESLIKTAIDSFGTVDIIVNNVGYGIGGNPWDMPEETWDAVINANLKTTFNCSRFACGIMKEQGWGRILNATSPAWLGTIERIDYCAAKAGVVGMTRALARDLGQYGITCNAYAPRAATRRSLAKSFIDKTRRWYESGMISEQKYQEILHPPSPDTLAVFLAYLCTDDATNINGQVFYITGGVIGLMSEPGMTSTIYNDRGIWTIHELAKIVPETLLQGYKNPAPPTDYALITRRDDR